MSDLTLQDKQTQEAYRQMSADQMLDIYERSRQEGKKRDVDTAKPQWAWRQLAYVLAMLLTLGLVIFEYLN